MSKISEGGKTSEALFFTRIFRGNPETRTFRFSKTEKLKSSVYCLMPSVILRFLRNGIYRYNLISKTIRKPSIFIYYESRKNDILR